MTKLLEKVLEKVRELPKRRQNAIAKNLLHETGNKTPHFELTPQQIKEIKQAQKEVRNEICATDRQMASIWKSFGL